MKYAVMVCDSFSAKYVIFCVNSPGACNKSKNKPNYKFYWFKGKWIVYVPNTAGVPEYHLISSSVIWNSPFSCWPFVQQYQKFVSGHNLFYVFLHSPRMTCLSTFLCFSLAQHIFQYWCKLLQSWDITDTAFTASERCWGAVIERGEALIGSIT